VIEKHKVMLFIPLHGDSLPSSKSGREVPDHYDMGSLRILEGGRTINPEAWNLVSGG